MLGKTLFVPPKKFRIINHVGTYEDGSGTDEGKSNSFTAHCNCR